MSKIPSANEVRITVAFARRDSIEYVVPASGCLDAAAALLRKHPRATHVSVQHWNDHANPYDGATRQAWIGLTKRAEYVICGTHDRAWIEQNAAALPRLAKMLVK